MSSTQLGLVPEFDRGPRREDGDFYPTPRWLARAALRRCLPFHVSPYSFLDAGAGLGALGLEVEACAEERVQPLPRIAAVELSEVRAAALPERWEVIRADFFDWAPRCGRRWDFIVTNPPYQLDGRHVWTDWITLCLGLLAKRGTLLALGHDLMWTTPARAEWWKRHPPHRYLPSPRRPSFTGDGGTDGRLWAWWEWRAWGCDRKTTLELLEVEW